MEDPSPAILPDARPARRHVLMALVGLPILGSACRSSGTRLDSMPEIQERTRARLRAIAESPAEADTLVAIFDQAAESATGFVTTHVEFLESIDRMMKDWSVSAEALRTRIESNIEKRRRLTAELLERQEALQVALGRERWQEFAGDINDPDRMQLAYTRTD